MPITASNPFKGRQYPGELIALCVRWYLRYPLSYAHVSELLAERGMWKWTPGCNWRSLQAYAPELNKRCRPFLRPTNKSYDEVYGAQSGEVMGCHMVPVSQRPRAFTRPCSKN